MRAPIILLWLGLFTATAAAETAPACWMASDLAYHKGDERVHKTVARIAPPQRILAEYSPLAQRGTIRRVKLTGDKKLVALTFDLCEQPSGNLRLPGRHRRFSARAPHQGHLLHGRQVDALAPRAHAAAHGGSAVRSGKPHLGTPESAAGVGTGARRRNQECADRLRAGARGARSQTVHGTARQRARARASAAAARPPSLSVWGLQRGGVGRSRAPGLTADPVGCLIRRPSPSRRGRSSTR